MHIMQYMRTKKTFCSHYTKVYKETVVAYHCRPVLNVHIEPSFWTTNVLTLHMSLNILDWAILPCKLQYNTRNQKGKGKLLWDCFHLKFKTQKGGHPAGQLDMFFLSPEDESGCLRWLGTVRVQPWDLKSGCPKYVICPTQRNNL